MYFLLKNKVCDMDHYLFLYPKLLEASELWDGFTYGF